jgi:hypothetical protein
MVALADEARAAGVTMLGLEVIVGNDAAYHLYQSLGYQTLRRLHFLSHAPAPVEAAGLSIHQVTAAEALEHYRRFHATPVPWQRTPESLLNQSDRLIGWMVGRGEGTAAYAVTRAPMQSIHWHDLAAENAQALRTLVTEVHARYPEAHGQAVNIGDDDPAYGVLIALNYRETISQWEMLLPL